MKQFLNIPKRIVVEIVSGSNPFRKLEKGKPILRILPFLPIFGNFANFANLADFANSAIFANFADFNGFDWGNPHLLNLVLSRICPSVSTVFKHFPKVCNLLIRNNH